MEIAIDEVFERETEETLSSIKWTVLGHFLALNFTPKNLMHGNKIFFIFLFFQFFLYLRLILTPNTHA